jgi:hypothetical protein
MRHLTLSLRQAALSLRHNPLISATTKLFPYVPIVAATIISELYLYAAYNKLVIFQTFVSQLSNAPIVKLLPAAAHSGASYTWAVLVPAVEILIPVLFLFRRTRMLAFYSAFFLMLLFTIYVFVVPAFFHSLGTCNCGGIINGFTWEKHFYFNLGFLALSAIGLIMYEHQRKKGTAII